MTRLLLFAVVACATVQFAACSPAPERNETAAAATPATFAPPEVVATPAPSQDTGAKPRPGALKTFGDWTVGCDNMLGCELRSLGPESVPPDGVTVSIARAAGPAGKLSVSVNSNEADDLAAAVDGKSATTPAATVAAMANGRIMAALAAGRTIATVSLKGASAALRYIDAVQGRAGTVTASVAKGLKPASAVLAPLAAPVIVAVTPGGTPASATVEQLAAMRQAAGCDSADVSDRPEHYALGRGKTLLLLPCSSGAYNLSSALFVLDGTGFAPARTDAPVGFGDTGAQTSKIPSVVNGGFRDGVLTSYAKGRGIGDCGVRQDLVWDGTRLRLSEQREMGECRGNIDYITTWRARVVRR